MAESFFTADELNSFDAEMITLDDRIMSLIESFLRFPYRNEKAREFARHGFSRRLFTLKRCVQRVFSLLPPWLNEMPSDEAIEDATVNIQAFVFNAFGAIDNLAWIWVSEKKITQKNGNPIAPKFIGLGAENRTIRGSLPKATSSFLESLDKWFVHLHDFRHALAHRIPLYVLPYIVPPQSETTYMELNERKWRTKDSDEYNAIKKQQMNLVVFRPLMKHSLYDEKPPIAFHSQLLIDLKTVELIGTRILEAMNAYKAS